MQNLTLQQATDYLEAATINTTIDSGFAVVKIGVSNAGVRFVLTNDMFGDTTLAEAM